MMASDCDIGSAATVDSPEVFGYPKMRTVTTSLPTHEMGSCPLRLVSVRSLKAKSSTFESRPNRFVAGGNALATLERAVNPHGAALFADLTDGEHRHKERVNYPARFWVHVRPLHRFPNEKLCEGWALKGHES